MKGLGFIKTGLMLVSKHKSAIMGGLAILTSVGGAVLAVKATVQAVKDIEEATEQKQVENSDEEATLTKKEVVKTVWKSYIPVVITTAATITLIICAHRVDAKRIAAATGALAASEKLRKELENKTIDEIGKEKVDSIKKAILNEDPKLKREIAVVENAPLNEQWRSGKYVRHCWFKSAFTGREFWSTKNDVMYAINAATKSALKDGHGRVILNDIYDYLGIDQTGLGNIIGWDLYDNQEIDVTFESDMTGEGEPCLLIHYVQIPREFR